MLIRTAIDSPLMHTTWHLQKDEIDLFPNPRSFYIPCRDNLILEYSQKVYYDDNFKTIPSQHVRQKSWLFTLSSVSSALSFTNNSTGELNFLNKRRQLREESAGKMKGKSPRGLCAFKDQICGFDMLHRTLCTTIMFHREIVREFHHSATSWSGAGNYM